MQWGLQDQAESLLQSPAAPQQDQDGRTSRTDPPQGQDQDDRTSRTDPLQGQDQDGYLLPRPGSVNMNPGSQAATFVRNEGKL